MWKYDLGTRDYLRGARFQLRPQHRLLRQVFRDIIIIIIIIGVHLASWVNLRSYLEENVAAPV
jgi:hypothetical protein